MRRFDAIYNIKHVFILMQWYTHFDSFDNVMKKRILWN